MRSWRCPLTVVALAVLALVGSLATPARATEPGAQLGAQIEAVFAMLADPGMSGPDKAAERRASIRRMAEEMFDFKETARRALGSHWASRAADEQARFVTIFVELVDRSYLRRVDQYRGEKVVILGETIDGNEAVVRTNVIAADGDLIPVEYLMTRDGERWRAVDVKFGGMSLVGSYRAQFNKIIQSSSYDTLVTRLQTRVATP